ncbi:MAG TPA: hypothetical protein VK639_12860 [Terriglobales bacterium]|nr:hypothetical protein [Terriglobales bacterium]
MVEDPKWELAILATVQGFYEKLLQDSVGGEVPVPVGLEAISLQQSDGDVHETLATMRRWLRLLDMAITPAMLRHGFTPDTDPEIAEAMLRYFARTKNDSDVNRDKTDLVTTFLYRRPRVPGQWERRGYGLDGSLPLSPFEIALIEILADSDTPSLPEEHVQILRRFDALQEEAENFSELNELLESGIISRVREMKQALDLSFYHPGVLATIAPYNAALGKKFDELFLAAAAEIKSFAQALESQGGSILGNVDGVDVTVEDVSAMEAADLLRIDYGTALKKFDRVSKLRKALERRPPIRRAANTAPSRRIKTARASATTAVVRRPALDVHAMREAVTPAQISAEETRLVQVEESIRVFVRVADPKFRQIVPMRFFNLILSPAEADAYSAGYRREKDKGILAEVARVLLRSVAATARMTTELEELKRCENSPSLWKLHADSLIVLLEIASTLNDKAERLLAHFEHEDSLPHSVAIRSSMQKLRDCAELAVATLTGDQDQKSAAAASR